MKALVYTDVKRVEMQTRPVPEPAPNEILLRVHATGICGSDIAGFVGHSPRRKPPLILGHETLGIVEKMPTVPPPNGGEWEFKLGQRVVVNPIFPCWSCPACDRGETNICASWRLLGMDRVEGAFADYATVPARNAFLLPESLPDIRAVMIEPLANGVHLFTRIQRHNFGNLAILGAGTQGCLLLSVARMLGYREIAIVDINPKRLAVAKTLGAKYLINAREQETISAIRDCFPGGADIIIDAHGDQTARVNCVGAVRKGGEIIAFGLHEVMSSVDFTAIIRNEINVRGSFAYAPPDFARSKQLIENGDVDLSAWTEALPLEDGQAAFDKLITDPGDTMKIMLTT